MNECNRRDGLLGWNVYKKEEAELRTRKRTEPDELNVLHANQSLSATQIHNSSELYGDETHADE